MKSNFFKISLNGLEFNSKIGYHNQEQIDGNLFLVNLDLKIKRNKINDNLNMTVDYEKIYDLVKHIMSKKMKLIETLLNDVKIFQIDFFNDSRGFFSEIYQKKRYENFGILDDFVQENH